MNNDKRKSEYFKAAFNDSKTEIEEILSESFQPNRCWIMLSIDEQLIQVPTFLLAQLSDFILEGETVKISSTKGNLKEDLETYYEGCEQIFSAAGRVFIEYLQSDYKRILESDNSLQKRYKRLNSLIEDARHYISCYGHFGEDLWHNTGGLIYGSPVDEVLSRIGEPISISLKRLPPKSYYSSKQWKMNLDKLSDIQKAALPKAKQYISLQVSKKNTYGTHQDNSDWVKENWFKHREQLPSDRQADLKIKKLYEDEFNGMTISTSQIQRYTGRQ